MKSKTLIRLSKWIVAFISIPLLGFIYAEIYDQVSLNLGSESYQSGWHIVTLLMLTTLIYVVSGITALAGHSFENIKMTGLELFFKSSLILTALPWVLSIISTIIAYLIN